MPLQAFLLVVAAAALHAAWNFVVKKVDDKEVFTWWTLAFGALLYLPLVFFSTPVPGKIWPYALSSALVEVIYFISLVYAYEHGDFSLVYPIARGAAPAMLAVWAMLFLDEQPHLAGLTGLGILLAGLTLVGGAGLLTGKGLSKVTLSGVGTALAIALWISIYSAIDGAAVKFMAPQAYAALVLMLTAVLITPMILLRYGRDHILSVWRVHFWRILTVSSVMLVTFILVLQAYTMARVSYVAALRELSVVFAAVAGWRWLGEEFGLVRTTGAILLFVGIVLISLAD